MANLKEIRSRITSVSSTMQITSAMKMVSAAKLKKAQDAITQMRPYAEKLQEILGNLSSSLDISENRYAEEREVKEVLLVAVTSNRGLCGGFNNSIIKRVKKEIQENYSNCGVSVVSVGKKAFDAFKNTEYNIKGSKLPKKMDHLYDNLVFEEVAEQAQKIMDAFLQKRVDKVVLIYNQFKNAATQEAQVEQFLPVKATEVEGSTSNTDYLFEPSKEDIVKELIPKSLKIQFYKAILDSHAGEHGARMTAMHKATDNAMDLKKDLTLSYNKARQAAITNEILEIVAGAEALEG